MQPKGTKPVRLLTRDDFRNGVFRRDNHSCVICNKPGVDAHHIMERRLFTKPSELEGYILDNGATLCAKHHLLAEQTLLTCEEIREKAGIINPILPAHLYKDERWDKWGNLILINGQRLKGELFLDESVQKILRAGGVLNLFQDWVKHPRTHHLPWSEGATEDDRFLEDLTVFIGRMMVATIKLDGEQTTCYTNYVHARSIDGKHNAGQAWMRNFHAQWGYLIPKGWRVCGDYLREEHTIHYQNLSSYFYVHSIWNEANKCLSWEETEEWAQLLGLSLVPVIYKGIWDERYIRSLYQPTFEGNPCEGYVLRPCDEFDFAAFKKLVGKFVAKRFATSRDQRHGSRSNNLNELTPQPHDNHIR